ncbi:SSCRP protein [Ophiocordyceps camponoti-floridani]|uniref:SSCRP protein n=1 Tax=Ophiocordyceps camponoti-floridani TaxID=2030778 RepID=A0A8H4Q3G6_9HYPO|nr:SSCRP protein [Ophiocordyceps camponoti-floridani]
MRNLLAALLLAGSALSAPAEIPTAKKQSCTSNSSKVREWTVSDFDFHASYIFSTPAHQNSWGYVNFTLINPIFSWKLNCAASSNQLEDFFYGTVPYKCNAPGNIEEASFSFSRPSGELLINQTWSCPYEGSRFEARGGVKLDLKCRETRWDNPSWKSPSDGFASTRTISCDHVTVKAPVKEMSGVA